MSRIHYNEDDDVEGILAMGRWIARENKVMKGKPAQKHFKALKEALEAMPHRRLADSVLAEHGEVCAIGAYAVHQEMQANIGCGYRAAYDAVRGKYTRIYRFTWGDEVDHAGATEAAARDLGINETLAWMIQDLNDGGYWEKNRTPEQRWQAVYNWCCANIREPVA